MAWGILAAGPYGLAPTDPLDGRECPAFGTGKGVR
jgi:hypothetical protein